MSELKECPVCEKPAIFVYKNAKCDNLLGNCPMYRTSFPVNAWNNLLRKSDIAASVAAERARVYEVCVGIVEEKPCDFGQVASSIRARAKEEGGTT